MLDKNAIVKLVTNLNLPANEYWVTAGAGLVLHGVKEHTRDIDIGATTSLMDSLVDESSPLFATSDGARHIKLGEEVELFENWVVDNIETIDGVRVASLLSIKKQKSELGRGKDLQDIALIDAHIEKGAIK